MVRYTARLAVLTGAAWLVAGTLSAQPALPAITLAVDATDAPRRILHARETIAVRPGTVTLLYPKWIPGEHSPSGPVIDVAGIKLQAGSATLAWRRDLENVYAIRTTVPQGSDRLDLSFDFILSPDPDALSSSASASARLVIVSWNQVVIYPADARPDSLMVAPSLQLPRGWKHATALTPATSAAPVTSAASATSTAGRESPGDLVQFDPVTLTMLVDSPVLAGQYMKRIDLTPPGGAPHFLNMAADSEAALAISDEQIGSYRRLVVEANALFGARHFDRYEFLYALSDQIASDGLEHHQSSDNRVAERTVVDEQLRKASADLLPHEYVHSWNGKYRRPSGLATGDFSTPMKTDLLWVYEGLTQYLGKVLAVRSGLLSGDDFRGDLSALAARLDTQPGRQWRPLQDTSDDAQLLYFARNDWSSWRRDVDFYDEGVLIWLEADVTIRQLTAGRQSLDDFCRKFYGGADTGPIVKPYGLPDLVAALNEVAPNDWTAFFDTRLRSLSPHAPLGGIQKGGWRLAYGENPTAMATALDVNRKRTDLRYSLGIILQDDGKMTDVVPGTPAADAGLGPTMKLIAVNGRKYSSDLLKEAVRAAKDAEGPIELIVANGDFYSTRVLQYHAGERYPFLERDESAPDLLTAITGAVSRP
jgi:predicted metalloprotease with PDZ domain